MRERYPIFAALCLFTTSVLPTRAILSDTPSLHSIVPEMDMVIEARAAGQASKVAPSISSNIKPRREKPGCVRTKCR